MATSNNMTSQHTISQFQSNFLRFSNLIFKRAPKAVRSFFDVKHPPSNLPIDLANHKSDLYKLRGRGVLSQCQWDTLFPTSGITVKSTSFDITLLILLLRNMTKVPPPTAGFDQLPARSDVCAGADLARIKFYRNQIAHTNDGQLSNADFSTWWSDVEHAILRLGGTILHKEVQSLRVANLDDADKEVMFEICRLRVELQDTIPWNIKVHIAAKLENWLKEDDLFVETRASKKVYSSVQNYNKVTVIGNPGCGKSSTIHHVALKMQMEGYTVLPIKRPEEIVNYNNPNEFQIFVVDDPCGEAYIDSHLANEWIRYTEEINEYASTKNKLLFSVRKNVWKNEYFKRVGFLNVCVIDMQSQNYCLTLAERQNILNAHINTYISLPENTLEKHECFPLLCKMFSKNEQLNINPQKFFENPFSEYIKELDLLKNSLSPDGRILYCILVCCIIFGSNFSDEIFVKGRNEQNDQILEGIFEICNLKGLLRSDLLNAAESLVQVYIRRIGNTYRLFHSTLKNIITWHIGQISPELIINYAPINLIKERVRPLGKLLNDDPDDDYYLVLQSHTLNLFVEEMAHRLLKSRFNDVFGNPCFQNPALQKLIVKALDENEMLCKVWKLKSNDNIDLLRNILKCTHVKEDKFCFMVWVFAYGWFPFLHTYLDKCEASFKNELEIYSESAFYLCLISGNINMINYFHSTCNDANQAKKKCLVCYAGSSHTDSCLLMKLPKIMLPSFTGNGKILNQLMQLKICNSLDVNAVANWNSQTITPLIVASKYNYPEITSILLNHDAEIDKSDDIGNTPFHVACKYGHIRVLECLLRHGNVGINKSNIFGMTPLMYACKNGELKIVKLLCRKNADVHLKNSEGCTALRLACDNEYFEIVKELIAQGAELNSRDKSGVTPLIRSVKRKNQSIAVLLIENEADVNVGDDNDWSPLLLSLQYNLNELSLRFLEAGANVHCSTDLGRTPVHIVCHQGNEELLEHLITRGADINKPDKYGISPLSLGCEFGHRNIVSYLLSKEVHVNISDYEGKSALHVAAEKGFSRVVNILLSHPNTNVNIINKEGQTPLHIACRRGRNKVVQMLINHKADINGADLNKMKPIHYALNDSNYKIVSLLVNNGFDINDAIEVDFDNGMSLNPFKGRKLKRNSMRYIRYRNVYDPLMAIGYHRSLLHLACRSSQEKVVSLLIRKGAKVNAKDSRKQTPLHLASIAGNEVITRALINGNADIMALDEDLMTPLHYASINGHAGVVELLTRRSKSIDTRGKQGSTTTDTQDKDGSKYNVTRDKHGSTATDLQNKHELKSTDTHDKHGSTYINFRDKNGSTALHLSCIEGYEKVVKLLLKEKANINAVDEEGQTSLHNACTYGFINVIELLLSHGSDIDARDNKGRSSLFIAAGRGLEDVVQLLINNNAEVNIRDIKEQTPLHSACMNGYKLVVRVLLQNGADVHVVNKFQQTPLLLAFQEKQIEIFQILLHYRANANQKIDIKNRTILHLACIEGNGNEVKDMVKFLIRAKANVNALDIQKRTPLHHACAKGHYEVALLLIENSADFECMDTNGNAALHLACKKGFYNLVELLLKNGALLGVNVEGQTPLHVACQYGFCDIVDLLLKSGSPVNIADKSGFTPLHLGCNNGYYEIVSSLLKVNPNKYARTITKHTPMDVACETGYSDIVKLLIENGYDVNKSCKNTPMPLHRACFYGNYDVAKELVDSGAYVRVRDPGGMTPLTLSQMKSHQDITRLLVEYDENDTTNCRCSIM